MRKIKLALTLFFMLLYAGNRLLLDLNPSIEIPPSQDEKAMETPPLSLEVSAPPDPFPIENKKIMREHTFKAGDSLFGVLSVLGVPDVEIFNIFRAAQKVYDLRRIIPGQKIRVFLEEAPQAVGALFYEIDPFRYLKIERSEDGFHVVEERATLERDVESHGGIITDTLFESARRVGVPPEVILDLADIFAWDLDFSTDIQSGDQFRVVYEVFKKEGETLRIGRVQAAEMVNGGQAYRAYYFAPHGTPVMAASDGVVTYVGWKRGHGKTVMIRHRNGYSTLYGHLSNYRSGIQKGKKVAQGDIVGRVGSTGLSTGPHLHYTLFKNGKPINPKNADVVRGEPLSKEWHPLFFEQVQKMNRYLEPPATIIEKGNSTESA